MIKITMLVPYEELIELARATFKEHNEFESIYNPIDDQNGYVLEEIQAVGEDFKNLKLDSDVILARGIIAELVRSNVQIPIVDISGSVNDLIRSLYKSKVEFGNKKVGIIGSKNIIFGAEELAQIVGLDISLYHVKYEADISGLVDLAVSQGCEVVVGGTQPCNFARAIGAKAVLIETSKVTLWKAFTEAKRLAYVSRMEQEKAQLFKAILEYSCEGIIAVDKNNTVSVFNSAAGKMFKIQDRNLIGSNFREVVSNSRLTDILSDETEHFDEIIKYNDMLITANKVPIMLKEEYVGNLVTFQNVKKVQELEVKIREKIHALGHVAKHTFKDIIGESEVICETIKTAKRFSRVSSNILIIGETGTGKELFAQSIHNNSPRNKGPFVAVNCAALPESLLESELFGYVAGAFTGALKGGKLGLFEVAHKGTIFLDEIGELSLKLQGRLLRVIQEREIMRLGDNRVVPVDVRVICATNKDLYEMAEKGDFRKDLYYRLDVLKLTLPTLNQRKEDIPLIIENFITINAHISDFKKVSITKEAQNMLQDFDWPGNVRELGNICERLIVLSQSNVIDEKVVQAILGNKKKSCASISNFNYCDSLAIDKKNILCNQDSKSEKRIASKPKASNPSTATSNLDAERQKIKEALERVHYSKKNAAIILGISRITLWRKMKELKMI